MKTRTKIAWLGTGLMGLPMAAHLANAGYDLNAWNRSSEKAKDLSTSGAKVCVTPQEAVHEADLVISMVSDGSITSHLVREVSDDLKDGAIWVDMSSTKAAEARTVADELKRAHVHFLDAPVSGGTKGAEAANLAIMVGGARDVFDLAAPVLNILGNPVHVGPVGAGQMCKLANQAIVAITIGAVAEAQLFLESGGVDTDAMRRALKGGFADSTILQQHGERMARRNFEPGGLSRLQLKDLHNVLDQANNDELRLPLVEAVADRFARYVTDLEGSERDHSGLFEELLDLNGRSAR